MSTTVAKKPPPATGRVTPTGGSPSRATAARGPAVSVNTAAGGGVSGSVARTRSVRTGTPVSARAAVAQRRESLLGNGGVNGHGRSNSIVVDAEQEEAARAETIALLDDLKERLGKAEGASESYKRQVEVLQSRLDESLAEQAKLEEKVHEGEEQVETLTNEKRDAARQMREMEAIYEAERSAMTKEKEEMANREEEMQVVIQRLKDSLAQRNDDESRLSRQSSTNSPTVENGNFAPPSSIQRSDSRNNSKLLLQKDKLIESLRLELAEAQIKLVESENQGGGRLQEVERLLMEARMANARLMEDNESYQLLLQERTLKGDFGTSDFSYMSSSANQDALAALEGRSVGTSLADELSEAAGDAEQRESENEALRHLEAENKSLKDQNKALTLYINKIIERLLQHQDFEHILDQANDLKSPNVDKDLPPPPPPKQEPHQTMGQSLLQHTKSIVSRAGGPTAGAPKPRPRPMTIMPMTTGSAGGSALNNPDTAPSIPIGLARSASTRRGRPMSEQYTGAGASIVHAMYRGGPEGPLSPSLRSSQAFFIPQGAGNRTSAGSGIPPSSSGNFPGMKSETSSQSGDDSIGGEQHSSGVGTVPSSPPPFNPSAPSSTTHSPPRSHHSEGGSSIGGKSQTTTTIAGNKPRPLRLVQENAEAAAAAAAAANNANKRQSWVGWFGGGSGAGGAAMKKEGDMIRE